MNSLVLQILCCIAAGFITLFLPGAAVLSWFPRGDRDLAQQWARAMGLSMAIVTLGALVTFLSGIRLNALSMFFIYGGFALLGLFGFIKGRKSWHFSLPDVLEVALILFIGAGLIAWRCYQARNLVLPAWVDSVQHVLIVQVILSHGGLPGNLVPYLPVPFYYHFGFHVLAAVFSFWSRLPADQAVLWFGQILEGAMSLAVYRLAFVIWKNLGRKKATMRGLAAALFVGLVTTMPGYYLTWGRYTLLAGLVLLAFTMAEAIEVSRFRHDPYPQGRKSQLGTFLTFALMVSGVLLTHYLVAIFLGLFLVILFIPFLYEDLRQHRLNPENWLPLVSGTTMGTVFALPWLVWVVWHAWSSFTLSVVLPAQSGGSGYVSYLLYLAGPQRNYWILCLAGIGLALVFVDRYTRVFGTWSLIFLLLCFPIGMRLGPLRPDIAVMMIFFPEVLLAGHVIVTAGEAVGKASKRVWIGTAATAVTLGLLCAWGVRETADILNPVTIFADKADRQAITWISQNLPNNAYFYLNTTLWQGTTYRGVDGGWWILPLTGRQTLLPPVVYTYGSHDYVNQINAWATQASQITGCSDEFWQLVESSGVNYIYLHEGSGSLQPSGLVGCEGIDLVYQEDGVYIYHIP